MAKARVYELAKELGVGNKEILEQSPSGRTCPPSATLCFPSSNSFRLNILLISSIL